MNYIKVSQAAEKWGLSPRRVRLLCAQNRIDGVIQKGKLYMIPEKTSRTGLYFTNRFRILVRTRAQTILMMSGMM